MKISYLKTTFYSLTTAMLLLGVNSSHAQQYYKWMDANGSTHYTATPPPKGAKRLDTIKTYGSSVYSQPQQPQPTSSETSTPQQAGQQQPTQQTQEVPSEKPSTTSHLK